MKLMSRKSVCFFYQIKVFPGYAICIVSIEFDLISVPENVFMISGNEMQLNDRTYLLFYCLGYPDKSLKISTAIEKSFISD